MIGWGLGVSIFLKYLHDHWMTLLEYALEAKAVVAAAHKKKSSDASEERRNRWKTAQCR
jgi:hypothetical protein